MTRCLWAADTVIALTVVLRFRSSMQGTVVLNPSRIPLPRYGPTPLITELEADEASVALNSPLRVSGLMSTTLTLRPMKLWMYSRVLSADTTTPSASRPATPEQIDGAARTYRAALLALGD